ncbi:hypothetical protein K491DRAFT_776974 [Lophiostoma macrostomum CBS 122681]|uniref:Zn(2)-C6 fungal-type domain-containing protein n=1 Tax=Lophiostoma macrostomum CBS 122681 TaxID=1314788 RepID=A0A6A6TFS9_9PLEO|nr:hypothetical protein K491DRAFT_776974 [Lophiostoma macrostomum CBS 122681]
MARTKTSRRCNECRKRKVKCDEEWPVCGPCWKGNKTCSSELRTEIVFMPAATASIKETVPANMHDESSIPCNSRHRVPKNLHMVTLRSSKLNGGTVIKKFRLLDLSAKRVSLTASPSLLPNERLSARLYAAIDPTTNTKIHTHTIILRELLGRFGINSALDNATLCLVSSHEAVMRGDDVPTLFNSRWYGKTLRSLQQAVNDREIQFSTETLAAISVMWRLEAIFYRVRGTNNQAVHGRAMTKMLMRRGVPKSTNHLEFLLFVECVAGDIQASLSKSCPSTFDTPEWAAKFAPLEKPTVASDIYWKMTRVFLQWPGFVHDVKIIHSMPGCGSVSVDIVLRRLVAAATQLESISLTLSRHLLDPTICITTPSSTGNTFVPMPYGP